MAKVKKLMPSRNPTELALYKELGEHRYMAEQNRLAKDLIINNPSLVLRRVAIRIIAFWSRQRRSRMANSLSCWAVPQAHAFRHTCLNRSLGDVPSSSPQQRPSCRRGICNHHSGISAPLLRSHNAAALQGAGRAISCLAYRLRLSGDSQGYASKRRRSGVHRYLVEVVTGPFQSLRQLGEVYSLATNFVGSCGFPTPAAVTCATPPITLC